MNPIETGLEIPDTYSVSYVETPEEEPFVLIDGNDTTTKPAAAKSETPEHRISIDTYKTTQRVFRPLVKQTKIPKFKGVVTKHPRAMVFATWNDHLSYEKAFRSSNLKIPEPPVLTKRRHQRCRH